MSVTDDARGPDAVVGPDGREQQWSRERPSGEFDRTPPQDLAAEQCVLGGMMLSKDAIADVVEILRSGDFYRPAHATIFDTILDLYGRGEPADPITVAAALTDAGELGRIGGANYLHTLISSVPTAANAAYYARIVGERAVLRRLVEAGTRIVQLGYGTSAGAGRDVDDIVDLAQQAVYDVTERRSGEDFAILADLLQPALDEIEAVGARDGVMAGVPTGFGDLDRLLNGLHPGQLIVVAGRPGLGKALALDTPLPTPDGWTTMGAVRVGARLLDAAGRPTVVTACSDVMLDRPCYAVEFSDGSVIVADAGHRWATRDRAGTEAVLTTERIRGSLRADGRPNHSVAAAAPLELPEQELPVAPYTLGAWLAAGHADAAALTKPDPELVMYVEGDGYLVSAGDGVTHGIHLPEPAAGRCAICGRRVVPSEVTCPDCVIAPLPDRSLPVPPLVPSLPVPSRLVPSRPVRGRRPMTLTALLRRLGLLVEPHGPGGKHIPGVYQRASQDQRRALLAGLLDAAGEIEEDGGVRLALATSRLAGDVRELVAGLGYVAPADPDCPVTVRLVTPDAVFRLDRKRIEHKERCHRAGLAGRPERHIVAVRPVPSVPVRCVSVANDKHLYLAGRAMIPTHNSTVSMDFARNASVRHNVPSAIFSLEMSKIEIVTRLLSAEARVPLHVLRSGQLSDDDWTRLARRMGEISEAPIFIDDTPNMTLMEIRAKARRLRQRHELKLVVVDYLQLMTSPKRVESRQQEVAELSRGLKLLAKEIECPVVAVSQLNRGPEQRNDKRPQLSDLRESGSIEQDADVVILLHRDDYYDKESPRAGEADFIVAKHRNGPTDTVTVAAQLHFSRFVDMAVN